MNISLKNLRDLAMTLKIHPFYVIKSRTQKGKQIQWKSKTKEELREEIRSINPKHLKKLMKVGFANQTVNNSGNTKSMITTQRSGRCPRLETARKQEKKCNDVQIRKDCKFSKKGNQPPYSETCMKHFPCFHKKGFAELHNANNFKHYLQTQNSNYRHSPTTITKRESRQNYGYIPAKNTILVRSQRFEKNLAILKKKNATSRGQLILLENGNILHVSKNANGVLKINKK